MTNLKLIKMKGHDKLHMDFMVMSDAVTSQFN